MSIPTPKIDQRTEQDIINETSTLVKNNTEWGSLTLEKTDAGLALIRIFGHMATLVRDRFNRVPDKNFIAFLNLLGAQSQPPQSAKVPLTFHLVEGSPGSTIIPALTQVSAPPAEGEEEEVIFETTQELVATAANLQAVYVRDTQEQMYSDRTAEATGEQEQAFSAFVGDCPIEYDFYLACEEVFSLSQSQTVTLTVATDSGGSARQLAQLLGNWFYWDGTNWQSLTAAVNQSWHNLTITLADFPALMACEINGQAEKWLRVSLNVSNLDDAVNPEIININASVTINQATIPESCLFNDTPLDLSKQFYPFGEEPSLNDTFYIALDAQLIKPDGTVELSSLLSYTPTNINQPEISWEIGDGKQWQTIESRRPLGELGLEPDRTIVSDQNETKVRWIEGSPPSFTAAEEKATLQFPQNLPAPSTVNEETSYWLRAVITGGYYGQPAEQRKYNSYYDSTLVSAGITPGQSDIVVDSADGLKIGDTIRLQSTDQATQEEHKITNIEDNTITVDNSMRNTYQAGARVLHKSVVTETIPATYDPPIVQSLQLTYNLSLDKPVSYCAINDFTYFDGNDFATTLSKDASSGEKIIQLEDVGNLAVSEFINIEYEEPHQILSVNPKTKQITLDGSLTTNHAQGTSVTRPFIPLTPLIDTDPTIYFGFEQGDNQLPFQNNTTTLYFQVEPQQQEDAENSENSTTTEDTEPLIVVWEYSGANGWKSLGVEDGTLTFSQRGLIEFIGPTDFSQSQKFGNNLYWLRARWESGDFSFDLIPRLQRVLTNTTWATQTVTFHDEVLGSSSGDPGQEFFVLQPPVLLGQQLEVEEGSEPSTEEQEAIEQELGEDAITIVTNSDEEVEEVWVRWQEVVDFYDSGPKDRHYTLDRQTGKIQFGDGKAGMVPSIGRNNLRLSIYQTGGGPQGNRDAGTITQLKTTIPYIDSVTNLEMAQGGVSEESLAGAKERVPKQLRHGDRAVTNQDFEDLAYEASIEVARVKVISPELREITEGTDVSLWNPADADNWLDSETQTPDNIEEREQLLAGQIKVIIVPYSSDRQPTPNLELINRVETYLTERCLATVELTVTGPKWQEITVTTEIVPVALEGADAVRAEVLKKLSSFLNPLTGGSDGTGWSFGRYPYKSELYALLESISGVDHVSSLEVQPETIIIDALTLIYSGEHVVNLLSI